MLLLDCGARPVGSDRVSNSLQIREIWTVSSETRDAATVNDRALLFCRAVSRPLINAVDGEAANCECLASQAKFGDETAITLYVFATKVVEQSATLADHEQ